MYDELVKELREAEKRAKDFGKNPYRYVPYYGKAADAIEELQKRVPKRPHGRLGDLDKLENGLRHMAKYQHGERQQGILGCCETIRLAPTIIPAEPSEEQREYEAQVEAAQYCEMYEPSYDPETGAL